jgi:hypothetical protein
MLRSWLSRVVRDQRKAPPLGEPDDILDQAILMPNFLCK